MRRRLCIHPPAPNVVKMAAVHLFMASIGSYTGLLMLSALLLVSACTVMFHGPPPVKIKREPTPSKDLSPCRKDRSPMPFREKCLFSYRFVVALGCFYSSVIRGALTMCFFLFTVPVTGNPHLGSSHRLPHQHRSLLAAPAVPQEHTH